MLYDRQHLSHFKGAWPHGTSARYLVKTWLHRGCLIRIYSVRKRSKSSHLCVVVYTNIRDVLGGPQPIYSAYVKSLRAAQHVARGTIAYSLSSLGSKTYSFIPVDSIPWELHALKNHEERLAAYAGYRTANAQ